MEKCRQHNRFSVLADDDDDDNHDTRNASDYLNEFTRNDDVNYATNLKTTGLENDDDMDLLETVSYTHLTLPTIA